MKPDNFAIVSPGATGNVEADKVGEITTTVVVNEQQIRSGCQLIATTHQMLARGEVNWNGAPRANGSHKIPRIEASVELCLADD